jgi:hypothetical protein
MVAAGESPVGEAYNTEDHQSRRRRHHEQNHNLVANGSCRGRPLKDLAPRSDFQRQALGRDGSGGGAKAGELPEQGLHDQQDQVRLAGRGLWQPDPGGSWMV